ncbi:MAG: flippase-like domain-containing protein [Alphaproteobacteria bacterium]|nr:flippase-like domain-containing protein [Alphaproteobacteria bacterium]
MSFSFNMPRYAALLWFFGLGMAVAVIVWSGYGDILRALGHAGWKILIVAPYRFIPMLCCAFAWRALIVDEKRPSIGLVSYFLWIRSAVDNLMPAAHIGGEIAALRVMAKYGFGKAAALASMIVEVTLALVTLILFGVVSIAFFAWQAERHEATAHLLLGLSFSFLVVALLFYIQRQGLFRILSRISRAIFGSDAWLKLAGDGRRFDQAVDRLYGDKRNIFVCSAWELLAWVVGSGETWLALYILGHPVSMLQATLVEALVQVSINMFFMMPAALGVQETGFVLAGYIAGVPPDIAAALAVIRRCGDLLAYVPGLVAWQIEESIRS